MRALSSDLINALVEISGHAPMVCAADEDIAIAIEDGVLGARDELVRLRETNDDLEEAATEHEELVQGLLDDVKDLEKKYDSRNAEAQALYERAMASEKALADAAKPTDEQIADRDRQIARLIDRCAELRRIATDALEAAERRQFDRAVRKTFAQRLSRVPT